jgi:predicted dehydrogenase
MSVSRRDFLKSSAAVSLVGMTSLSKYAFAAGSDKLRVGVIGCGGRGTGAAYNCVVSAPGVEIYALGDLFKDRLDGCVKSLTSDPAKAGGYYGGGVPKENFNAPKERQFVGFDAYQKVIDSGVDMIISAAPPHFRPIHLKAAIEAGKHVFMEKPAGVDPVGIRSVIESSELAKKKGLAIVAGTQRRHQKHYVDILKRVNDGQIGEIKSACCYWNGGDMKGYWKWYDKGNMSGMEWQCRSWPWFTWTSGDHVVEQHVHNIDVINWAIGAHPIKCMGMGGREVRNLGNIYDHFAVEFEYPNGVRVMSMCRQIDGCTSRVAEYVVGTDGIMETDGSNGLIKGKRAYTYNGPNPDPYVVEHTDLIDSIRSGNPLNEGKRVAESTLCAIMGRMSAYTGRAMKWDWVMKASELDLSPEKYDFAYDMPMRPIAVPGKTQLI